MPQALQSLSSPQAFDAVTSTVTTDSTAPSTSVSTSSLLNSLSLPMKFASIPMSMLSKLFTAGSTATAAKAATTAANELGAVQAAGTHCGTEGVTLASLGRLGGGWPVVTAGLGHATSIGALSARTAWTAATPAPSPLGGFASHGAMATASAPRAGMPPMMPITSMSGRPGAQPAPRFGLRSTVVPFSPAAG